MVRISNTIQHDPIRRLIARLAHGQQGVVARWQLLELGISSQTIHRLLQDGTLYRVYAGVYGVGHRPVSPHARAMAAVLACGPHAVLSHGSAATLWGITPRWRTPLEVTAPTERRHRELRTHRSSTLRRRDVTKQFGIPVTSPARTLFDLAPRLTDRELARAVNDLRLAAYLSLDDLAELLDLRPHAKATKRLREFVAGPTGRPTRSAFEDAFVRFATQHGLPEFVTGEFVAGYEADFFFPAHGLVVELDGYRYHGDRDRFESDRDRDADRLAQGIVTLRVTWERFRRAPEQEAERLRAILAERERGTPPHTP